MKNCKLCESKNICRLDIDGDRRFYFLCGNCRLISADPESYPSKQAEIGRYAEHHNGLHNEGYVRFLQRALSPALGYLSKEMVGLDYGCGPNPTLSKLLAERGLKCYDYDPLFGFDHPLSAYDFLFATECFEHFFYPAKDIAKITELLKQGGMLTIMTEQWESVDRFKTWYYKRDFTHVSFYHADTLDFVSQKYGYAIRYRDRNRVTIMEKI